MVVESRGISYRRVNGVWNGMQMSLLLCRVEREIVRDQKMTVREFENGLLEGARIPRLVGFGAQHFVSFLT